MSRTKYPRNWTERAVRVLESHTDALMDDILRFVELNWDPESSDEENLDRFETYQAEHINVLSY